MKYEYEEIKEFMTTESPIAFDFWTREIKDIVNKEYLPEIYNQSRLKLKEGIENGILDEEKYLYEYYLLCFLSGIEEKIDVKKYFKLVESLYCPFIVSYIGTDMFKLLKYGIEKLHIIEIDYFEYYKLSLKLDKEKILE